MRLIWPGGGAAILHLHVQDPETARGSREPALYAAVAARLRKAGCPALINLTAGMGSLDCGSLNSGLGDGIYVSARSMIRAMAARIKEIGVRPKLEAFDFGQLTAVLALEAEGLIAPPPLVQCARGLKWGAPPGPRRLLAMGHMRPVGHRIAA
jgi:uncharacterized protein (DUF849 family)